MTWRARLDNSTGSGSMIVTANRRSRRAIAVAAGTPSPPAPTISILPLGCIFIRLVESGRVIGESKNPLLQLRTRVLQHSPYLSRPPAGGLAGVSTSTLSGRLLRHHRASPSAALDKAQRYGAFRVIRGKGGCQSTDHSVRMQ